MKSQNKKLYDGVRQLIEVCGDLKYDEKTLIISDTDSQSIGNIIEHELSSKKCDYKHKIIEPYTYHGQEPPESVSDLMKNSDLIFGLTKKSMFHTIARQNASLSGAKYLSLPDYTEEVLIHPSLQADFKSYSKKAFAIGEILTSGAMAYISSSNGTNLRLSIKNRVANPAPGWCYEKGSVASPPDAECNVAIVEDESEGVLIVDGSIPYDGIGLLSNSVKMVIKKGRVQDIIGPNNYVNILTQILFNGADSEKRRVPAELGIGLNDLANFCGILCIDEGVAGSVHIGLGSNITIGGENNVKFHLDLILNKPTLKIDNFTLIKKGEFTIE